MPNLNIQPSNYIPYSSGAIVSPSSSSNQEITNSRVYKSLIKLGVTPHSEWKEGLPFIGTAKLQKMHDNKFLSDLRSYMLETGIMQKKVLDI